MQNADLIIHARWLLPIVPKNTLLEHHSVAIANGNIVQILPRAELDSLFISKETFELDEHVLMPGLVNLHAHAAMNLMRGLADDLPLMPWLKEHIWPAERNLLSPDFVRDGTTLACAEMLSGGVTMFNDMYFYPDQAAQASLQMGMRANLGLVVLEFPTPYANDADHYIQNGLDARDQWRGEPLVSFSLAPHAPYTVSDATIQRVATLAEQVNIGIHTHLHETQDEIRQGEQDHGLRPIARLANLGLLGPSLTAAHCVHLTPSEMQLMAEYGCHIAHCPSSNLKLASGIAPISVSMKAGINVGLGTDGAASNNRLDMFTEMRLAALLAKGASGEATALSAHQVLEMATINGAKALGLEDRIGSVEVGKCADLTAVKLSDPVMQPCFNPVSHLVYVAGREQVSHVWVNGELTYHQMDNGVGLYRGAEPQELTDMVARWQNKVEEFQ
jgi:5-methylthioadenosine/S-adenosylhomocysteine deaminase